jgi:glycogen operon protein
VEIMGKFKVKPGIYFMGAIVFDTGVNFGVFSRNATQVTLVIYKHADDCDPIFTYNLDNLKNKTGDIWHVFLEGMTEGYYYGWKVDGPFDLKNGHRFNPSKILLDPYSKAITPKNGCINSPRKGMILDTNRYSWSDYPRPKNEFKDTIIYEMHIKLFTMNDNSKVNNPGTYKGVIEKIDYLKELGVTAVQLLPIFEFDEHDMATSNPITGESLKNVWGYNPIGFYAPTSNYVSGDKKVMGKIGQHVIEFRELVTALHNAGIEVILDVVFNHTGEGNEMGPAISFKGLDNSIYYILNNKNKMYYANYSGTGNTVNCSHTVVKELITNSLRYWYGQLNVDGFRFDLAAILGRDSTGKWIGDLSLLKDLADDPVLAGAKLIAEGWDAAGGYFLGEFPCGWAELNGKFRDTVRQFIRGDKGQVEDLATRIVGSPDLFSKFGRKPYHSINFITSHDGFTMWDLFSYNKKHNHANGEYNRDGENHNHSFNHGVEGETKNPNIIQLRKRQVKNSMVILMLSQGVPMVLMGDEMCKTQNGNNNAYCQDNDTNWINWDRMEEFKDINSFVKNMIAFRKSHSSLKRSHFFTDKDINGNGFRDITWHGVKAFKPDWSYNSRSIAFMIDGGDAIFPEKRDNDIYVALNSYHEPLIFELPVLKNGKKWYRVVDTFSENDFLKNPILISRKKYMVHSKSSIILISK